MKKYGLLMVIAYSLSMAACGHSQVQKDLDQKVELSSATSETEDLGDKAKEIINSNAKLSATQKFELLELQKKTHAQIALLSRQSFKLRDLLISDIGSNNYNKHEVDAIEDRLTKIEKDRLWLTFDAVDSANRILGREFPDRSDVLRQIASRFR